LGQIYGVGRSVRRRLAVWSAIAAWPRPVASEARPPPEQPRPTPSGNDGGTSNTEKGTMRHESQPDEARGKRRKMYARETEKAGS